MQTCRPTDLWPNFKLSTPNPEDIPKPNDVQQHAPKTALDRAFIAAHKALQGDSITPRQLGWTSTQSPLGDRTNHVSMKEPIVVALDILIKAFLGIRNPWRNNH